MALKFREEIAAIPENINLEKRLKTTTTVHFVGHNRRQPLGGPMDITPQ